MAGRIGSQIRDGHDLLGVLSRRPDAARGTALLVEYDARLAARAPETAGALTTRVEVRQADAAQSDVCAHTVPANLVSLCGIFGNVSDADAWATVAAAPHLRAARAEVVWTRRRGDPDLTPYDLIRVEQRDGHVRWWQYRLTPTPPPATQLP